jgi:hypothetical protein
LDFDSQWGPKYNFFFSKAPRRIPMPAHPSAHVMGAKGHFLGTFNQPGCESQSVAKVKNAWSYNLCSPICAYEAQGQFYCHGVSNNCQACEIVMEMDNPYAVFFTKGC